MLIFFIKRFDVDLHSSFYTIIRRPEIDKIVVVDVFALFAEGLNKLLFGWKIFKDFVLFSVLKGSILIGIAVGVGSGNWSTASLYELVIHEDNQRILSED